MFEENKEDRINPSKELIFNSSSSMRSDKENSKKNKISLKNSHSQDRKLFEEESVLKHPGSPESEINALKLSKRVEKSSTKKKRKKEKEEVNKISKYSIKNSSEQKISKSSKEIKKDSILLSKEDNIELNGANNIKFFELGGPTST